MGRYREIEEYKAFRTRIKTIPISRYVTRVGEQRGNPIPVPPRDVDLLHEEVQSMLAGASLPTLHGLPGVCSSTRKEIHEARIDSSAFAMVFSRAIGRYDRGSV